MNKSNKLLKLLALSILSTLSLIATANAIEEMQDVQDKLTKINQAINYAEELKDQTKLFYIWDPNLEGLPDTLKDIIAKYREEDGKKINMGIFFGLHEGQGQNPTNGVPPDIAIKNLQNVAKILNKEMERLKSQK